jgi:hypothetical protein
MRNGSKMIETTRRENSVATVVVVVVDYDNDNDND